MESTFKSNVSIGAPKMSTRKSAASAADNDSLSMEALIPVINKLQDVFNTVGEAKVYIFICVPVSKIVSIRSGSMLPFVQPL